MFKPDLWQGHNEYKTIVNTYGRRLSRNNPKYSFCLYNKERQKLLNLNLDALLDYIPRFYPDGGRPAKHQAQLLHSLMLFVLLFNKTKSRTSLTLWVREVLPRFIALTVLIDFHRRSFPGKYGRTVYIKNHSNLRFHPRIPKDSKTYKQIYSERTACGHINGHVLNDYFLQHLKIRGKGHFSFWAMLIGICIHLDVRYKATHLYAA